MKCPCEECIKYPICIAKNEIWCTPFRKYADMLLSKYNDIDIYWDKIRDIIPHPTHVFGDKEDNPTVEELVKAMYHIKEVKK